MRNHGPKHGVEPDLPESDAGIRGGSGEAVSHLSDADLRRGYSRGPRTHERYPLYGPAMGEDESGDTYEGDPRARGGFLTRPRGEER